MSVTITAGWWLAPALITIAAFISARIFGPRHDATRGGLGEMIAGLMELGSYGLALLVSLVAWLIWALV